MNRNLGIDIKLTDKRLFPTQSGDFQWVGGIDNLEQALRNRIRTVFGALPFHKEYGSDIPAMVSRPNTSVLLSMIYTSIGNVLASEPRVKEVKHLSVVSNQVNTIEISVSILAITDPVERNILLEIRYPS